MKNVKLISLVLSMLICFVAKAQEKTNYKKDEENNPIQTVTQSFSKSKDTIPAVKVSSNFIQNNTSKSIKIVCVKSITRTEEPICILDGIVVNSKKIAKIKPSDIESIKVLKGIEATSIYGTRAINGAIIITSKRKE